MDVHFLYTASAGFIWIDAADAELLADIVFLLEKNFVFAQQKKLFMLVDFCATSFLFAQNKNFFSFCKKKIAK